MPRYALLLRAGANRVYGAAAPALASAEIEHLGRAVSVELGVETTSLGGVDYVVVDSGDEPVDADGWAVLGNLSNLHAAYELEDDGRLRPLAVAPRRALDEDLVTIQRYPGKTNEAFTHLLVNLALASGDGVLERWREGEPLRLLDPVCGRGTTLNRAALYGIDAHGVELEQRDVAAYETFISTWLKDKRLKHKIERASLRKGREKPAHRVTVRYGISKDTATHRTIDVVHDDTTNVLDHHKARSIDLLVADLPYGVQHGATTERRARDPEALLLEALPRWHEVLRPGAGVALAFNRRTLARARLVDLAVGAGLEVAEADDDRFVHRVDRSITRDVLVGCRPAC